MATITLNTPEGATETFECDEDTFILDALEEAGIDHPSSCRAGACSSCAMKIVEGTVNQEEQSFLDEDQIDYFKQETRENFKEFRKFLNLIERALG